MWDGRYQIACGSERPLYGLATWDINRVTRIETKILSRDIRFNFLTDDRSTASPPVETDLIANRKSDGRPLYGLAAAPRPGCGDCVKSKLSNYRGIEVSSIEQSIELSNELSTEGTEGVNGTKGYRPKAPKAPTERKDGDSAIEQLVTDLGNRTEARAIGS